MTDARLLARQVLWAATTPAAADMAFNVVNGDVFRWRRMWSRIAEWFGLEPAEFDGKMLPLAQQMKDGAPACAALARKHGLAEPDFDRLASPWHTDGDLGRPIEVVTDMSRSRVLSITTYQATDVAFYACPRADKLIPWSPVQLVSANDHADQALVGVRAVGRVGCRRTLTTCRLFVDEP